ncbi:MAG: hypothetical protein H0V17_29135 [Deltaproteobacteria bacterium]|nr:hypothetical protein [Deltaproteobacteria bacterium]
MGDENEEKPAAKGKGKGADKADTKAKQDDDAATGVGDQNIQGVDLRDLRDAYQNAHDEQNVLFNKRGIGVREVPDALKESDPPSLTDELMKTLVIAGLGFASGYVTAAITAKLVSSSAIALSNAVQTALDDGLKDAVGKVGAKLAEEGGSSMSQFFSSQEEGLESVRGAALGGIVKQRRAAEDKVLKADKANQGKVLTEETKGAQQFAAGVTANAENARKIQFRESLAKWMNAMSRGQMGQDKDKGPGEGATDLFGKKGVGSNHPQDFYKGHGAKGVVYVNFGMTQSRPGVGNSSKWPSVKISGITQSALDRLKGTPLKDLGMPVVVSGTLYDGFLDSLDIASGDNNVSFGRNEAGTTFTGGSSDGNEAMRKITGKSSTMEAAQDLLDTSILPAKLDNVLSAS